MKTKTVNKKIILIIVLLLIAAAAAAIGIFWYSNVHWFDKYLKALEKTGVAEKQFVFPDGRVINYGEAENEKPPLLLIHGQGGKWQDYALVMQQLSGRWHIYAVDVYGHGKSSHDEELYYIDVNGDDLITFINEVIKEPTVVAGHSNGALTAAYIAAYGGGNIRGAVLEDPPVFSVQGEGWEESFAYLDTYRNIHEYDLSDKSECWEAYYLRHCYWGKFFHGDAMTNIAGYAQEYRDKHPGEPVRIGFLPYSMWSIFEYTPEYDLAYGEKFYDLSWNNGYTHEQILSDIDVPCVYLHATENVDENGTYLCAASREQAERAAAYIGDNCSLIETSTSDHNIHAVHMDVYTAAIDSLND